MPFGELQEEFREDSPILPWLVEHAGSMLSRCQKGRDGGKKPTQESVPLGEKVLARPISSGKRAQVHSDPCRARIGECLETTPEGAERPDRRSEVLNEALAKDVERHVRRREEIESTAGELAAPQELEDLPVPPGSDPRKRRATKAVSAVASSGSSQMESSRAVTDESRMDVEQEERDESRSSKAQNTRRRIMTQASMEESQMDDEGKERDESRSSTEPNTRRRIATKPSLEESRSDERAVAVTTQESLDGIREKAMRIASIDELETGSSIARWSSPWRPENDRTGKANELVRSLLGIIKKEADIIVASGSKSKLWRDMSLKRAVQDWNMKYVDVARSPGSALRVFTSSERLVNQLTINEIREVGEMVTKTETNAPNIGKLVKKNEMDVLKVVKMEELENWRDG